MVNWIRPTVMVCLFLLANGAGRATAADDGPWRLGKVLVEQGWARLSSDTPGTAFVYLIVHNRAESEDLMLAVDSTMAGETTILATTDLGGGGDMEPMPAGLLIPGHGEVELMPGTTFVRLGKLDPELRDGDSLPVSLMFRDAGRFDLSIPVLGDGRQDPARQHRGHAT
jgi:copper(I)-binding protein